MSDELEKKCLECGCVIPVGSVHCPACMLGRAMGDEDSFGDLPSETTSSFDGVPVTEGAGDSIGAYKLLEKIGEGGFGVVYMAKQEKPVRRQVALKIVKLGMDTKQVVGRFEAERQALAMMEHPSIAKVLDAGSTDAGRPFFVMELVHGVPITEFCNENRLTTEERLRLFVKVCHAVQHAHQKGVIHRDLKPSNILVTMHDDEAVPKVIDFGIAKATQHDLTDKTLFTQFRHFLGTPAYMSPEQAQMSGLGVDTRSDIYSLGVLLYELLTGSTPLDLKPAMESGYDEVRRTIREDEPLKPSTFVSQLSGAKQTTLSKQSRMSAGNLHSQLRGDLDWIVMKAIEKDRSRRYETASSFARDLELYLQDEPVSAVAPSAWYLLTKMARRHKPFFASLALVLPLLVLAAVVSGFLYWKERQSTQSLRAERNEKEAVNQQLKQSNQELQRMMQSERQGRYASDLATAQRLVNTRDFAKAQRLLSRHRPVEGSSEDLREFSWYYLMESIRQKQGEQLIEEGEALFPMRFSPDGNWLVTRKAGGRPIVWDVRRRRRHCELDTQEGVVVGRAEFSTDSSLLMVREWDYSKPDDGEAFKVMLWRIDGQRFEPLPSTYCRAWPSENRYNFASAARFVPGTSLLALAGGRDSAPGAENDIVFYDVSRAEIVRTIPNAGTILDLSPDAKLLVTQQWQQDPPETVIWDMASGRERLRSGHLTDQYLSFLAPNQILITKNSGRMELRDVHTLEELELPLFPVGDVNRVQMSNDGRYFLLQRYLSETREFWDSASGYSAALPHPSAALSADGKMIAHSLESGGVALVHTDSLGDLNQIDQIKTGFFIPEHDELVVKSSGTDASRAYRLPEMTSSRLVSRDRVFGHESEDVFWTRPDDGSKYGARLVRIGGEFSNNDFEVDSEEWLKVRLLESGNLFVAYPNRIELRDRETLRILQQKTFPKARNLSSGAFLEEFGIYLPRHGFENSVVSISTETLEVDEMLANSAARKNVLYLPDEGRLVVFVRSGKVQEFSMPSMELVSEYDLGSAVRFADISADGKTIAVERRGIGENAIELISRQSRLPLISVGIERGFSVDSLYFMRQSEVLVAFLSDAHDTHLRWYPSPRAK